MMAPEVRAGFYGVAAAVGALLLVLGVTDQVTVDSWLEVVDKALLLVVSLTAVWHVPVGRHRKGDATAEDS